MITAERCLARDAIARVERFVRERRTAENDRFNVIRTARA